MEGVLEGVHLDAPLSGEVEHMLIGVQLNASIDERADDPTRCMISAWRETMKSK